MRSSSVVAIVAFIAPTVSATYYTTKSVPCFKYSGDITCNLIGNLLPNSVGKCDLDWLGLAGTCDFSCDDNFTGVYTNGKLTSCEPKQCKSTSCPVPDDNATVNCKGTGGTCDYTCPTGFIKGCNNVAGCTLGSCKSPQESGCSCSGRYCPGISNAIVKNTCAADGSCDFVCNSGYSKGIKNGVVQCIANDCLDCGTNDCKTAFDMSNPAFARAVFFCKDSKTCDYSCPAGASKTCNGRLGCFSSCPAQGTGVPAVRRRAAIIQRKRELQHEVQMALKTGPSPVDGTWGSVLCPATRQACSVPGSAGLQWECVDTKNDFSSCGGCLGPNGKGTDCESIPGVLHSSCGEGKCIIHSCTSNYKLQTSTDGSTTCVRQTTSPLPTVFSTHTADTL